MTNVFNTVCLYFQRGLQVLKVLCLLKCRWPRVRRGSGWLLGIASTNLHSHILSSRRDWTLGCCQSDPAGQNFISVPLKSESSLQKEVLPSPTTTQRFILATIQILFFKKRFRPMFSVSHWILSRVLRLGMGSVSRSGVEKESEWACLLWAFGRLLKCGAISHRFWLVSFSVQ